MTTDELKELRARVGKTTRGMARLAMLADPTGWSKIENGRAGIDPARLVLVRAKVAAQTGDTAQALALLTSDCAAE
jgi:transcriptional regulator with XRE-family HTH domain